MRVLVLGAGGFLGSHAAARLRELPGTEVLTGGRAAGRADLVADLGTATADGLAAALRALAPDAVVNCAGAVGGGPVAMAEANARGPAVLCEAVRAAVPRARVVHLGSAAEYGPPDGAEPLAETAPARPVTVYGATKLAGTAAVTACGLDAVVLRVFNPVGPGAPPGGLPGRLAAGLLAAGRDGAVRVGDLSAYRDFVDVRDVARAVALAVTATAPPAVLNVAGGRAVLVRELARGLAAAAGFRGRIEEDGGCALPARSAPVTRGHADITAADRALGWRPRIGLHRSLADLWHAASGTGPAGHPSAGGRR
ncbi:NAD-dependent epimerase/dehydratase family protein [Streptomyces capparidis]